MNNNWLDDAWYLLKWFGIGLAIQVVVIVLINLFFCIGGC